jgi:small-conductance mechanosensitive channel
MTAQFTNWTRNNRMVRKAVKVGVAYGTDTEMVSRLLLDIAAQQEHVLKEPAPFVLFDNFGDSSLDFTLYVYVDDFSVGAVTASRLRHRINQRFEENNISIPFPQLDVHTSERFGAAENQKLLPWANFKIFLRFLRITL